MNLSISARILHLAIVLTATGLIAGCSDGGGSQRPEWVEQVYPEPGATAAVPDAVEVDHTLQRLEEDVRLLIDGTDVTTYATFEAGKIRYESGDGPVTLGGRSHTAEVQRVELVEFGADYEVLDSFTWEFRTA